LNEERNAMTVRAKFVVQEIARRKHWDKAKPDICDIKLSPVTGGSAENDAFYAATPGGQIVLGTCNSAAVAALELGKAYYVDFLPAE
jgi:hypothetical protein